MSNHNHRRQLPERVRRALELRQGSRTDRIPAGKHRPARKTARTRALREQDA